VVSSNRFKDLRIELIAFKTQDRNYQTNFKYLASTNSIENLSPTTSGTYSVSILSFATAFSKSTGINNTSTTFQQFLDNRAVISKRLGGTNPNSGTVQRLCRRLRGKCAERIGAGVPGGLYR
jgi:cell surface protein SprA